MASVFKRNGSKARKWLIAYKDADGRRRVITGVASKSVTEQIAAKLESEVELRRRGIIDERLDRYAQAEKKSLADHLEEWRKALAAKNPDSESDGAGYATEIRNKAHRIVKLCKAEQISQLSPSAVQRAIKALRESNLSLQTCNHYLKAIKQFYRWLWRDGRVRENILAHLSGYNVALDRRHDRRALSDDELTRLIVASEKGSTVLGVSGPERAMLYRLAANTGYRRSELRSLTPESFDLSKDTATITVEAAYSKHGKRDVQPIRADMPDLLRPWLMDKTSEESVFHMSDVAWHKTVKMMRRDLAAAGIRYRDSAGLVADFHALRHTYISNIVRSGASVKICQDLARHSDPKLTLGVYTHLQLHDKTAALEALPPVNENKPERESRKATGTDDVALIPTKTPFRLSSKRAAHAQRAGASKGNVVLSHATGAEGVSEKQNSLKIKSKAILSGPEDASAPVAQLDRASVFGTEG